MPLLWHDSHATAIPRFQKLIPELQTALELMFRIGLRSGPIAGGVIRGQNARFQLFGDTSECQMIPCYRISFYCALTVFMLFSQ
jgi:hypothetical protein